MAAPGHTCALLVSGEVACWGGGIGPVKNGSRTSLKRPTLVRGLRDAIDVATGLYHTCVAHADGTVSCWGWDSDGELGGGPSPEEEDEPVVVPKLSGVVELASRASHTCARRRDGHVLCWGKNDHGQLGRPPVMDRYGAKRVVGPVEVPGLADAVQLVVSHTRSCARRASGQVVCWGESLGSGAGAHPTLMPLSDVTDAVGLAADFATCAVRANGEAVCISNQASGRKRVLAAKDVVGLGLGPASECAVTRDGAVLCWGDSASGELGDGTIGTSRTEPRAVIGITDATQVVSSWNHHCALRRSGQIACWGANNEAQLGIGDDDVLHTPHVVPGLVGARVAVGLYQSCAITPAKALQCWGHDVTRSPHFARSTAEGVAGVGEVIDVAVGFDHGCALTPAGGAVCWGDPGRLGTPLPYRTEYGPRAIEGVSDAVAISTGEQHTCARRRDGTVVCWGQNHSGQLGDGTTRSSTRGVVVTGLRGVVDVRCGDEHTCAVLDGGEVRCWGKNDAGQLGSFGPSGDPVPASSRPLAVAAVQGATAVAAGSAHSCAIVKGGAVTCWGHDHHGAIMCSDPGGCRGQRFIEAPELADATAISAGGHDTCVLRAGGAIVRCWSRIGEDGTDRRDVALAASSVAAGGAHVCAITNGQVACWGKNDAGEVGASPPYRTTPVPPIW